LKLFCQPSHNESLAYLKMEEILCRGFLLFLRLNLVVQ
jgi:hypothetical protein